MVCIDVGLGTKVLGGIDHIIHFVVVHSEYAVLAVLAANCGNHDDVACITKGLGYLPVICPQIEARVQKEYGGMLDFVIGR